MERDANNGNAETTDILVILSRRVETWRFLKVVGFIRHQVTSGGVDLPLSTTFAFLNHILVLFLQVHTWRPSVNTLAICVHPPFMHLAIHSAFACILFTGVISIATVGILKRHLNNALKINHPL